MSENPQYLGQYELTKRLASGGMGELFMGRRVSDNEKVVLKLMRPEDSVGKRRDRLRGFLNEARVMTLLNHPNIVRIYEVDFDQGSFYMAMEYLVGWSLAQVMNRLSERNRLLPLDVAIGLVLDACRGLHFAHEAKTTEGFPLNLVHRDVHHGNLFVTAEGGLKILDFGIAKSSIQMDQTRVGLVKGTAGYMSPEQCHARPLDRRSDIFTLGIVLHELLSGKRLYSGTMMEGMIAITSQPAMPPTRKGESLPESLVAICMRTLQQDPNMRYPSAEALAKDLEDVAREMHLLVTPSRVVSQMDSLFREYEGGTAVEATAPTATEPQLKAWAQTVVDAMVSPYSLESEETDRLTPWEESLAAAEPTRVDSGIWPKTSTQVAVDPEDLSASITAEDRKAIVRRVTGRQRAVSRLKRFGQIVVGLLLGAGLTGLVLVIAGRSGERTEQVQNSMLAEVPDLEDIGGDPASEEDETANPESAPAKRSEGQVKPRPKSSRPKKDRRPPRRPPKKVAAAPGKLTLEAVPWAKVYFEGKLLGTTPLVNQVLPAGKQQLRLVNPQGGIDETVTLEIPSGGSLRKKLTLR